jgi:hypothetical protein
VILGVVFFIVLSSYIAASSISEGSKVAYFVTLTVGIAFWATLTFLV